MARDNMTRVVLTTVVERMICSNLPASAAREALENAQQEFGGTAVLIYVDYTDDKGRHRTESFTPDEVRWDLTGSK